MDLLLMIYNYSRKSGKSYQVVFDACHKAIYSKPQLIVVPNKESKKRHSELVLQIMDGAWPIRLKIKTVDELNKKE